MDSKQMYEKLGALRQVKLVREQHEELPLPASNNKEQISKFV